MTLAQPPGVAVRGGQAGTPRVGYRDSNGAGGPSPGWTGRPGARGGSSEPIPQVTRGLPKGDLASERSGSGVWARGGSPQGQQAAGSPLGHQGHHPGPGPGSRKRARWGRRDSVCLRAARATGAWVPLLRRGPPGPPLWGRSLGQPPAEAGAGLGHRNHAARAGRDTADGPGVVCWRPPPVSGDALWRPTHSDTETGSVWGETPSTRRHRCADTAGASGGGGQGEGRAALPPGTVPPL